MPTDHTSDPWAGATYNGFAGGARGSAPEPRASPPDRSRTRAARRPSVRTLMLGGVAAAVAAGLVFGVTTRSEMGPPRAPVQAAPPPAAPAASAELDTPAASGPARVPITVNPEPPPLPPAPRTQGRLEVLPPEMAQAARAAAPIQPLPSRAFDPGLLIAPRGSVPTPSAVSPAPAAPARPPTPAPAPAPAIPAAAQQAPRPQLQASFDCAAARPGAEQMVCADPQLAAADRQLARAYARALRSGVDPGDLRQEQRDWMAIREDAARHSPRALAEVYDQRLQELDEITERSPAYDGGGGEP